MRLALTLVAALSSLVVAAACSSSSSTNETAAGDDAGSSGGGGDDADTGGDGASSSGDGGSSSGKPGPLGACTIPDSTDVSGTGALVALSAYGSGADVAVYLSLYSGGIGPQTPQTRRYTVTSTSPCVLARDMSFGSGGMLSNVIPDYADATGHIWTVYNGKLRRAYPGPAVDCTADASFTGIVYSFAINAEATVGYVIAEGGDKFGKVTITGDTCSITSLTFSDPLAGFAREQHAVDDKGRLLVSGRADSGGGEVQIFDGAGILVTTYSAEDGTNTLQYGTSVARCASGACVLDYAEDPTATKPLTGSFDLVAFDDKGKFVSKATTPIPTGVTYFKMAAVPTGPVFVAGSQLAGATSHVVLFVSP